MFLIASSYIGFFGFSNLNFTYSALSIAYLVFSSLLLILNVVKIVLNLFNLGDFVPNPPCWVKGVNITISILEGIFMLGFNATFVAFMYFEFISPIDFLIRHALWGVWVS